MSPVIHIFKREFSAYMVSPVAYIVISVFLIITGWFFFTPFFLQNQASLRNFFSLLPLVFAFVVPAITMRLLSEEFSVGSYETLLTLPVTFSDVILGKFLAATGFTAVMLAPTLLYPLTVSVLGIPGLGTRTGRVYRRIAAGRRIFSHRLFWPHP